MARLLTLVLVTSMCQWMLPASAQDLSSKSLLFSDGLSPHVDNAFWTYLPSQQSVWPPNKWAWGQIPDSCYDLVTSQGLCNPYDVEVYDVKFPDVSSILMATNVSG